MLRFPLAALALAAAALSPAASAQAAIIGVLEERPPSTTAEKMRPVVRAVFHKDGQGWKAYPTGGLKTDGYPARTQWTIGFDGKVVGELSGVTPKAWDFYSDVGSQSVISAAATPFVGKRSMEFAGFPDQAVHRPLVATSTESVADPEGWKRAALKPDDIAALRKALRARAKAAERCKSPEENVRRPFAWKDSDLVIDKAYASTAGWRIARVQLPPKLQNCDSYDDDPKSPFVSRVFAMAPTGAVKELGAGLLLVDAGDYDGDGKSELVFQLSGDNQGGYTLFTDGFAASATFAFGYH